jgi:hypothetical protein
MGCWYHVQSLRECDWDRCRRWWQFPSRPIEILVRNFHFLLGLAFYMKMMHWNILEKKIMIKLRHWLGRDSIMNNVKKMSNDESIILTSAAKIPTSQLESISNNSNE